MFLLNRQLSVSVIDKMQNNQGIQQLLAAEKKAAEKVSEARKRKIKRLRQAKEEADEEIEAYRLRKEQSYQDFISNNMGSKEDVEAQIEKDTDVYLDQLEKTVSDTKQQVITELIDLVMDVTPKVHPNFFVLKLFDKI